MKTIILALLLLCLTATTFAQKHYTIPVIELDSNDVTAFRHKPVQLEVDVNLKNNSWDTIRCTVITTYFEDASSTAGYISKETMTRSIIDLPLNSVVKAAFNPDGTISEANMNLILNYFKLKVKPVTP